MAPTPKRHYCYANSPKIVKLDKGKLTGWKKDETSTKKTAVQYRDAQGRNRYKGTKNLKSTERLDSIWFIKFWKLIYGGFIEFNIGI